MLYSFLFGLLHGIVPDEHTWPITFSYAIGSASGKQGMRAALYFSAAFTFQRALLSEAAYLALAPFLLSPTVNSFVYLVVGLVMAAAGIVVLRRNRYPHLHLLPESRRQKEQEGTPNEKPGPGGGAPPVHWTLIHGFIAGFGLGGFSLFVNTLAAPAMRSPWLGFLPGLAFGIGTTVVLILLGTLIGASLRWVRSLTEPEIQRIGAETGGRTLFFGGLLFTAFGIASLAGLDRYLPVDVGQLLIILFMVVIVIPALVYSIHEVLAARKPPEQSS